MASLGRPIGAHMPLGAGMVRAADRAAEIGASAIQVFADNPSAWKRRDEPATELPAFRARLAHHGIDAIAIHAAYLINLAGPDPVFHEKSVGVLAAELAAAPGYGARLVNVHTGSHRGAGLEAGVARLADGIVRAFDLAYNVENENVGAATDDGVVATGVRPMLALENAAGGGWTIGSTVEELARVAEAVARRGLTDEQVGFCLDTAHLWAAGHSIDRPADIDDVLAAFDRELGLERLVLVHLNDSKSALGSHVDRHEHLGAGSIGEVGLGHLLRHPRLEHVMFVVETPDMDEGFDAVNVGRARDLLAARPLAPLPVGAAA